jgi:2-polyprenyl-6-methoxyphenol hydroxylase-like FAD-dependent oxidoreductase
MSNEVVVVGGGPVGLMLAAELQLGGVQAVVLERLSEPTPHSRAFRLQTRTLELLDQRGLAGRFTTVSKTWPKAHFAGLQPLLELDRLDSDHPYCLLIPQARTERLLAQHASELGVRVLRGHEVVGLSQDDDEVTLQVRGPAGEYPLTAPYVVGCDGARSAVRRLAGIPFPGTEPRVSALLGDVCLPDPTVLPMGVPGTLRSPSGLLMAVSLEDGVTRILTTEFDQAPGDRDTPVTLAELGAAVRRVTGTDVEMTDPRWLSRFTDATRQAEQLRRGRVLLAGDAAHVHFPIGAQGLNLGLQDAVNLGWKLAATIRGRASQGLLDTYHAERHPAATRVLRETRAQLALMNPDERINPLRELLGELLALPQVNLLLSEIVTGLDVAYAGVVPGTDEHPLVGRRAPRGAFDTDVGPVRVTELLRTGWGVLLVADGAAANAVAEAAEPWTDRIDVIRVSPGATPEAAILVRPDGYVGWALAEPAKPEPAAAAAVEALTAWFGPPAGPSVRPIAGEE